VVSAASSGAILAPQPVFCDTKTKTCDLHGFGRWAMGDTGIELASGGQVGLNTPVLLGCRALRSAQVRSNCYQARATRGRRDGCLHVHRDESQDRYTDPDHAHHDGAAAADRAHPRLRKKALQLLGILPRSCHNGRLSSPRTKPQIKASVKTSLAQPVHCGAARRRSGPAPAAVCRTWRRSRSQPTGRASDLLG
jgi:hypothetical protein